MLHALGVDDDQDLLPARGAFVEIGPVVERPELAEFAARLGETGTWLVTAAGGLPRRCAPPRRGATPTASSRFSSHSAP